MHRDSNINLIRVFRILGINLDAKKIDTLNVKSLTSDIYILKSRKEIDNTQYTLLMDIKYKIEEFQQYKNPESIEGLDNLASRILDYSQNKSSETTNELKGILHNINSSSKEVIINPAEFNEFNKYLHVKRPIEDKLVESLQSLSNKNKGIILLVGSVGDGKSHLLSYLNKTMNHLFDDVEIYNDATESNSPNKTAVETLAEELREYNQKADKKIVMAINIGILLKLRDYLLEIEEGTEIVDIVKKSNILDYEGLKTTTYENDDVSIVSFLSESTYEVEDGKIYSKFYDEILDKIFNKDLKNPFYEAYINDDGENRQGEVYKNYRLLLNKNVQESIKLLIIKIQVENKRILTTRSFLNFLHDIIVPDAHNNGNDALLVNLLFNNPDKSSILRSMSYQDPLLNQSALLDRLNIEIYNTLDLEEKCKEIFHDDYEYFEEYLDVIGGSNHKRKFEMIIRFQSLFDYNLHGSSDFLSFIELLDNIEQNGYKKDLLEKIVDAITRWNGSPKKGFIYKDTLEPDTKLRIGLEFQPKLLNIHLTDRMSVEVRLNINNIEFSIEVDSILFYFLNEVSEGYVIKAEDKSKIVVFDEFVENIVKNLSSNSKTIINITKTNDLFEITESYIGLGYDIRGVNNE